MSNIDIWKGPEAVESILTRMGVELILERLGNGCTVEQLIKAYPRITAEQIHACQSYAAEMLASDEFVDIPYSAA